MQTFSYLNKDNFAIEVTIGALRQRIVNYLLCTIRFGIQI